MSFVPSLAAVTWLSLGLIAFLLLNALFNVAEAAVAIVRPHTVRYLRETDAPLAARLQPLIDERDTHVAACLLGSRLVRFGLVALVLALAPAVGQGLAHLADRPMAYGWTLLGTTVLGLPLSLANLVFGEFLPRAYGTANPLPVVSRLSRLVRLTLTLLAVPARGMVALTDRFEDRFGDTSEGALEEEIKTLAESGEETGQIESDERVLIHSVFEFADTVAREIMTPRVEIDAMPMGSDPADVVRVVQESGHSRIPLYDETDDNILGVVHAKDLLGALAQGRAIDLKRLLRPVLTVPEGKGLRELLGEMRAARTQMAIVQDEFGGTAGIVTIEDIVEELVGDIVDEYDDEESEIMRMGDGWLVSGKMHLDDLNGGIGTAFQSDAFDTLGGFIFGQFGRQPGEGESIDLDGHRITVTETDGRRVGQVRIEPVERPDYDTLDVL